MVELRRLAHDTPEKAITLAQKAYLNWALIEGTERYAYSPSTREYPGPRFFAVAPRQTGAEQVIEGHGAKFLTSGDREPREI